MTNTRGIDQGIDLTACEGRYETQGDINLLQLLYMQFRRQASVVAGAVARMCIGFSLILPGKLFLKSASMPSLPQQTCMNRDLQTVKPRHLLDMTEH